MAGSGSRSLLDRLLDRLDALDERFGVRGGDPLPPTRYVALRERASAATLRGWDAERSAWWRLSLPTAVLLAAALVTVAARSDLLPVYAASVLATYIAVGAPVACFELQRRQDERSLERRLRADGKPLGVWGRSADEIAALAEEEAAGIEPTHRLRSKAVVGLVVAGALLALTAIVTGAAVAVGGSIGVALGASVGLVPGLYREAPAGLLPRHREALDVARLRAAGVVDDAGELTSA